MGKIGIFYGSSSGKTEDVAIKIMQRLGKDKTRLHNVATAQATDLDRYDFLIFGIPTWGIGELQDDWAGFITTLENTDLKGKKVALFGLGDQEAYPETFADALGIVYESIRDKTCKILGQWPVVGYQFDESRALQNNSFTGLVLDEENQPELTEERIEKWLITLGL